MITTISFWDRARALAFAMLAAGAAATIALNGPGHLSYDSILQLLQGRSGRYNTWHPPVMAWLMGLGDAVVPGTGLFVAFDTVLAFGALAGVLMLGRGPGRWAAAVVCALIVLSPQMAIYQGIVWKDVLFADSAVAGFVALALAAERAAGRRWVCAVSSFALLALAALTRQNGVVLLPFAAAAAGWIAARESMRPWRAAMLGAGALVALVLTVAGATALLNLRSDGESGPAEQFRLLQVYDIAGALSLDPDFSLAPLDEDDPELAEVLRKDGRRLYTPERNDPLAGAAVMQHPMANLDDDAVRATWNGLVTQRPWLYLRVRAMDFAWIVFTPDIKACRPIFTGIEGPQQEMEMLGLAGRKDARDRALDRYGHAFFGTPVLSHIPFLLIAAGGVWLLLRRRRPADIALAAMLAGALAFTASFFVIAIACDYRYLYVLDLSALAALLYVCVDSKDLFGRMG
jgi:4-amino-4-deoxy-L-arabinose transferase-like glycosyltransferase